MQKSHITVQAVKQPRLKGVGIGLTMETCENWDESTATAPCLYQGNTYIKRKLRVWRDQKHIPLVSAKIACRCAGRQTNQTQGSRYRAENGNLRKLGWTYRHGTVFAPKQYLYVNKATGMERPEMYFPGRCENLTCAGC